MKQMILTGWNAMRFIRLVLGIIILVQAVVGKDAVLGVLGLLFSGMALLNIGCCGLGGCNVPAQKINHEKDISYEEVTGKK